MFRRTFTRSSEADTESAAGPAPRFENGVVSLPRSRRGPDHAAARRARLESRTAEKTDADGRAHGWTRTGDPRPARESGGGTLDRRRADGTPLLLFMALAVLTGVGLVRVSSRIEVLQVANEITALSEEQQHLLDRKRRLETERAYLRRPGRVAEQAGARLGMEAAPPERIQRIELEAAPEPAPEHLLGEGGNEKEGPK